jgi:hypothetical protein
MLDLKSCLAFCRGQNFRYVVLEEGIKRALNGRSPGLTPFVDVIPHPVNEFELGGELPPIGYPAGLGMLGAITEAKGFPTYAELAAKLTPKHGSRLHFHIVGRISRQFEKFDFTCFEPPVSFVDIPRKTFIERARHLHFVCFPLQGDYYSLAASGTLIDAITLRKPIIALSSLLLEPLFEEFGDIGYLCKDKVEFEAVLLGISADFDPGRYSRQVEAITRLYLSRTTEALTAKVQSYLSAS